MPQRKILQIVSADNWFAVVSSDDEPTKRYWWPLSCWALIENEEGDTEVVGMDAHDDTSVNFTDLGDSFLGYAHRDGIQPAKIHSE